MADGVSGQGVSGDGARVAAIDCGTNSTRLLVGELGADGRLVTIERLMRITRLGRGTDATGLLDPAAVERTVEVLREFRTVMDRHGVAPGRVRIAATSAARDAANRDEFFDAAEAAVGARPELLSGAQEAQLSFLGATADLDPALGPFLVMDIGGGSTETAVGTTEAEGFLSLDIGCVRMTEKYLLHDPPLPEELSNCLAVIEAHFKDLERELPALHDAKTFVGLAGTITTAAAVEIGLATYDSDKIHHFVLSKAAAEDVFRTLATETVEERKDNPGLDPQRADVIVGGLCIFVQALRQFELGECLVSEADILDGLARSVAPASPP